MEISTSILSVKKENCIQTFYNLETAGTDYFHIDVMDGKFVENNTVELMTEYSEYLNTITNVPLDVHLMVEDVLSFIKSFMIFEPRNITVHYESAKNKEELLEWIEYIKKNNCKVGISIKPDTKVEDIYELLPFIHTVLIMTVEPGFGGQRFMPLMLEKVRKIKERAPHIPVEVDGGVNAETAPLCARAGADVLVAGSAVFAAADPAGAVRALAAL